MQLTRKLSVAFVLISAFVFIGAVAIMLSVDLAQANDHGGKTFQGTYAFTGGSACLTAPLGFSTDNTWTPNGPPGLFAANASSWGGTFVFNKNGTGTMTGNHYATIVPSYTIYSTPPPYGLPPFTGSANVSWVFTYTVSNDGDITFTFPHNTYTIQWLDGLFGGQTQVFDVTPLQGRLLAEDRQFIGIAAPGLLTQLDPQGNPTPSQLSCNINFLLIKQPGQEHGGGK